MMKALEEGIAEYEIDKCILRKTSYRESRIN